MHLIRHLSMCGGDNTDISIDIDGNVLTVSGKKSSEREENEADHYLKETSYGSFSRSLRLPAEVDEEEVDATYKDCVLEIVMKPKEGAKVRKIEIKG